MYKSLEQILKENDELHKGPYVYVIPANHREEYLKRRMGDRYKSIFKGYEEKVR